MTKPKHPPEESAADFIARMDKEAAQWRKEGERWRAEADKWREESARWRAEGDRYFAEAKRLFAQSAIRQEKIDRQLEKTDRQLEKNALQQAENDRLLKTMLGEHGGFTRTEGLIFEEEVVLAVKEDRGIGGIAIDAFSEDVRSVQGNQFDLVGINGKCAVIVEAKRSLRLDDITDLVNKGIPALKADFASTLKGKSVKGAIVYRRIYGKPAKRRDIARAALTRGIILVRVTGKNTLHHITNEAEVAIPARQLQTAAKQKP